MGGAVSADPAPRATDAATRQLVLPFAARDVWRQRLRRRRDAPTPDEMRRMGRDAPPRARHARRRKAPPRGRDQRDRLQDRLARAGRRDVGQVARRLQQLLDLLSHWQHRGAVVLVRPHTRVAVGARARVVLRRRVRAARLRVARGPPRRPRRVIRRLPVHVAGRGRRGVPPPAARCRCDQRLRQPVPRRSADGGVDPALRAHLHLHRRVDVGALHRVVVGFDATYSTPYWIIKNSWRGARLATSAWKWAGICAVSLWTRPPQRCRRGSKAGVCVWSRTHAAVFRARGSRARCGAHLAVFSRGVAPIFCWRSRPQARRYVGRCTAPLYLLLIAV